MTDLEQRVSEFCAAPAGCAFLLNVEQSDLDPKLVATPSVAHVLSGNAVDAVSRWNGDHEEIVAHVLGQGPRLTGLAKAILEQPEVEWWFAPVPRETQIWIGREGTSFDRATIVTPVEPPNFWERYAQKSVGGLYTSTAVDDLSSLLIAIRDGTGDYVPEPPYTRYLLQASSEARVYEVTGPANWHALCTAFPAPGEEDSRVVPDWSAFVQEWDAVHLTLGGLLAAEQVRVVDGEIWTMHDGWDAEQTIWFRDCFTQVTRLPDLADMPESDHPIPHWWYWAPDWDDNPKPWRTRLSFVLDEPAAGSGET